MSQGDASCRPRTDGTNERGSTGSKQNRKIIGRVSRWAGPAGSHQTGGPTTAP